MKNILIFFLLLCWISTAFTQNIKRQIGTTVWHKDGQLIADSSISIIIDYNKKGQKIKEWQVFLDSIGNTLDTSYSIYNEINKPIEMHSRTSNTYLDYDAAGTLIQLIRVINGDTLFHLKQRAIYDDNGLLIKTVQINGVATTKYSYYRKNRVVVASHSAYETWQKYNKRGHEVTLKSMYKPRSLFKNERTVHQWQRNKEGQILKYKRFKNKNLEKKIKSYYRKGQEIQRIEYFFNPTYIATTYFTYEYW